jgi:hypothetical protein
LNFDWSEVAWRVFLGFGVGEVSGRPFVGKFALTGQLLQPGKKFFFLAGLSGEIVKSNER